MKSKCSELCSVGEPCKIISDGKCPVIDCNDEVRKNVEAVFKSMKSDGKVCFIEKVKSVESKVTQEDVNSLVGLTGELGIAIVYAKAIWDVRNEIVRHLIELDPEGKREKLMRRVDEIVKNTEFEGLI